MRIEVFGTGCPACTALEALVMKVVSELNPHADVSKISDLNEIIERGIMMIPALAIDGDIKCSGRVPHEEELREWLS